MASNLHAVNIFDIHAIIFFEIDKIASAVLVQHGDPGFIAIYLHHRKPMTAKCRCLLNTSLVQKCVRKCQASVANEHEAQELEGLRFRTSTLLAVLRRKAAELNQAGLVRMKRQRELPQPIAHRVPEAAGVALMLEWRVSQARFRPPGVRGSVIMRSSEN